MPPTKSQEQQDFGSVLAFVLAELTDSERAMSVVYLDERIRPSGPGSIAGHEFKRDIPYVIAFIDQRPGANWMHPCRYLLIEPVSGRITTIVSDHPPLFGSLPPTWRAVWRSLGIDDWRLLPISGSPLQEEQTEENS